MNRFLTKIVYVHRVEAVLYAALENNPSRNFSDSQVQETLKVFTGLQTGAYTQFVDEDTLQNLCQYIRTLEVLHDRQRCPKKGQGAAVPLAII